MGSDAPLIRFLRGIRPQGKTFEFEYLHKFAAEAEKNLGYDYRVQSGLIHGEKKLETENLVLLSL
jgi:hypothetical protein